MAGETAGTIFEPALGGLLRPRKQWHAWLSVGVSFVIFAAVNVFWRYLGTGALADLRPSSYYQDLTIPLGEVFLYPLSVLAHPWMLLVLGVLLGLLVLVPVVISVLYRPAVGGAFAAAVLLLGHAPMLALAGAAGCALGGRWRLRHEMSFLAMLLGLLPSAAYLLLSGMTGTGGEAVLPLQRWALHAPLVIAFVLAIMLAAGVLALAKVTGFRPGVLAPMLAALLGGPVLLFHTQVGRAELDYCLLAGTLQGGESIFEDEALEPWQRRVREQGLTGGAVENAVNEDLADRRDDLVRRCGGFLARHVAGPRRPAVLWLRAQAASVQVDQPALRHGLIRYSATFPLEESAEAWEALRREAPAAAQAALAEWRLGELALRRGGLAGDLAGVSAAAAQLARAGEALEALPGGTERPGAAGPQVFVAMPDFPPPAHYQAALRQVRELLWLISQNQVPTNANAAEALAAQMSLNPRRADYHERLAALLGDPLRPREQTRLGDNLKVAVAMALPEGNEHQKAEMLMLMAREERQDASITANFELGKLAMRTAEAPAPRQMPGLRKPEEYFKTVLAAPPNPYQIEAAELLASLAARAKTKN